MENSQDSAQTIGTKIDTDSRVGQAWQDHADDYEHNSEALRAALRSALLEDGEGDGGRSLGYANLAVIALMAGAIGSLVAQALLRWDAVVAAGLTGLVVLVVIGVGAAKGEF